MVSEIWFPYFSSSIWCIHMDRVSIPSAQWAYAEALLVFSALLRQICSRPFYGGIMQKSCSLKHLTLAVLLQQVITTMKILEGLQRIRPLSNSFASFYVFSIQLCYLSPNKADNLGTLYKSLRIMQRHWRFITPRETCKMLKLFRLDPVKKGTADIFIHFHPPGSTCILPRPPVSTCIHLHILSSTVAQLRP